MYLKSVPSQFPLWFITWYYIIVIIISEKTWTNMYKVVNGIAQSVDCKNC